MIVWLNNRRGIVPERICSKIGFVFFEINIKPPVCPCQQIKHTNYATHTSVWFVDNYKINRCSHIWRMADDAKVCFNTSVCPRTAQSNVTELHNVVVVDERLPC